MMVVGVEECDSNKRYVKLAPMSVDLETELATLARQFFRPRIQANNRNAQLNQKITPASGADFMDHLNASKILDQPNKYIYQIRGLLERMVASNILVDMGLGKDGNYAIFPKSYYTLSELTILRNKGNLWLSKILGGRFVYHQVSPAVVHILAENNENEGSGIIFDAHHILTCKHVVSDMKVARIQIFQGKNFTVENEFQHDSLDVAVIRVREPLAIVDGLGFLAPTISQKIYRFGYARVPRSIPLSTGAAPLVMQSGEVTSESVVLFDKSRVFLYSAVSRPGDSGGAIVSDDGYVVGMTSELSDDRRADCEVQGIISPHYVGVPSDILQTAVDELELGVHIPYETYD